MQFYKGRIVIFLLIIFLLSFLAYSKTFNGEFQFDDDISVIENPYVNGASKFSWHNLADSIRNGTRPFTTITFALNYQIGGSDVRWYHITNFLIHILNGLLVFYFVFLTMHSPKLLTPDQRRALPVALISAAIFLLHPIQTQAVSYIAQRYESLASLFYLCSLIAYIKARLLNQVSGVRCQGVGIEMQNYTLLPTRYSLLSTRYTLYAISIISGILALGSKEIAITIPVVIMLYEFYFFEDRPFLKRITGPGVFIILSLIAGVFMLIGFSRGIDAGFSVRTFTPWEYLLTQFRALTVYIRLLFLPINQNLDYDFRISKSLLEIDTFLSLLFILILIAAAIISFRRWRLGSFFILWFFIILAPTSSIIPIIDPIFEHRVYLASAGIFIIISDMLSRWILRPQKIFLPAGQRKENENYPSPIPLPQGEGARGIGDAIFSGKYNKTAFSTVAVLIVLLSAATFQRNRVWVTKLSLWEDAAKKSPMKSRVHNNLGNCYMLLDRYFRAIEEYKKAVALDSNNVEAYYNLGLNLENVGLLNQAVYYYDIFYKIAPLSYDKQRDIVRKRIDSFSVKQGK